MNTNTLTSRLSWRQLLIHTAVVAATVAVIVWFMPNDNHGSFSVDPGRPWRYADLTAPFDFPIYKSEATIAAERDSALSQFEPYYTLDATVEATQVRQFMRDYGQGIPGLGDDYISVIANRLHRLYQQGIMNSSDFKRLSQDTLATVRVVSGRRASSQAVSGMYSPVSAYEQLFLDPLLAEHREQLQKCSLNDYILPNLTYDRERSESSQSDLLNNIPLASGIVQRGQKIIDQGDIVDERTYNILKSYFKESDRRKKSDTQLSTTILGQILYVSMLVLIFTVYLSMFRKDYLERWRSAAMLYSLIVVFSALASLLVGRGILHVYILPFTFVPIIIRVFMDSRTAFMAHFTMVLICAPMLHHPMEFIAVETTAGLVAIYSLRELSSRSQLFKTAIVVTLVAIVVDLSLEWITTSGMMAIDYGDYNYLVVNGVLLFCSYPMLYLIEKVFGFTSDITLIELSDMNKELLRRMSEVAPGTFQHSIQVGNLAAEIAHKIGGQSLLVRTGALYHDIGKIQNPAYFTENQSGGINPHDNLSYVESAQVLISHVTEGLKLADKHNLPTSIREFIQTHHGQGKTKYFYVKQKNEHPDDPVDDLLFTYPGPNPFTKEQAILMMADSVEAASRSLSDYTEKSIRGLVDRIIDTQMSEGYFRECPITFRDIQYAKTVLIEKLKTIYHTRVSYPELKEKEDRKDKKPAKAEKGDKPSPDKHE